jgi:dipeptidase E
MKLLLTSGGLTNKSITKALFELVGKKPKNTKIVFIPTAANVEDGDKKWLINDLNNIKKLNVKLIDIVDISALPKKIWLPRLKRGDVLFFSGGNSSHLMYWLEKSGLAKLLPSLLKTRVYAGISAGSIVATPTLELSRKDRMLYYDKVFGYKNKRALGLMNFHFRPHLNSPYFPKVRERFIKEIAKKIKEPIYALDDESAIKVKDGKVKIVSEGRYIVFNE